MKFLALVFLFAIPSHAAELQTQSQAPAAARPWKASSASTFYAMAGTRSATANSYSFGQVRIAIQSFGLEYAANPGWKMVGRLQYVNNDYDLIAKNKVYPEKTKGLGDSYVGVTHPLAASGAFLLGSDAGLSLPTGSTTEMNPYSLKPSHYKYFLQLGSGTFDGVLGLTGVYLGPGFTTGARASAILRTGMGQEEYRLGNVYAANSWLDVPAGLGFTPRLTGSYRSRGAMTGGDSTIPRAATEYYYHEQVDWNVAAALKYEHTFGHAITLTAEAGKPFLQDMRNFDDVAISTRVYGNLSVAGQF